MAFMKVYRGIDLSSHNGDIDFKKVKTAGIEFAILRTGYGRKHPNQYDTKFNEYYEQCKANSIPVGAYHFSYALTPEDAVKEAEFMLEIVKDKQFEYPLYFDMETEAQTNLDSAIISSIIYAFCTTLEKAGYWAGIYSFDTFYMKVPEATQKRFAVWVARVENVHPEFCKNHSIWQYSWKGKVDGINCDVDMNSCYKDYPTIIKSRNLNGFGTTPKYEVVARISELNKKQADTIAEGCQKMGMNAIVSPK